MPDLVASHRISPMGLRDPADPLIAWATYFLATVETPVPEPEQEGFGESSTVFSQSLVGLYQGLDLTLTRVMRGSGLVSCERGTVRFRILPSTRHSTGATTPVFRSVTVTKPNLDLSSSLAQQRVVIPMPIEVRDQLDQYFELRALLPAICEETRKEFGPGVELSLEVYTDPEIDDRYLTLYVRMEKYDPSIIQRIETVSDRFQDQLAKVSGHLLLTTDFRSPRGKNAV